MEPDPRIRIDDTTFRLGDIDWLETEPEDDDEEDEEDFCVGVRYARPSVN